jgi:hypothetical protein
MWCYEHGAETQCHCLRWDTHTDADLAMALELADLVRGDDCHGAYTDQNYDPTTRSLVDEWLRTEVRNALLERAQ